MHHSSGFTPEMVQVEAWPWVIAGPVIIAFVILVLFREPLGNFLGRAVDVQVRWRWLGFFLHLQATEQQASEHKGVDADSAPAPLRVSRGNRGHGHTPHQQVRRGVSPQAIHYGGCEFVDEIEQALPVEERQTPP